MRILILSPSFYSAAVKAKEFDAASNDSIIITDSVEALSSHFSFKNRIIKADIYNPQSIVEALDQEIDLIIWCSDKFAIIAAEIYRILKLKSHHALTVDDSKIITDKFKFDDFIEGSVVKSQKKICPFNESDFTENLHLFDFPIFVKPNRSSGTYSTKPWGYKKYDSLHDFYQYLKRENLLEDFLKHNHESQFHLYSYGEYSIFEFIPAETEIFYVNLLKVGDKVFFLPNGKIVMTPEIPDSIDQIYFSNSDFSDTRHEQLVYSLAEKIKKLSGTFFLGVQFFDLGEKFVAFDVNTRLSTVWFEFQREFFPSFFHTAFSIIENHDADSNALKQMNVNCVGFKKLYNKVINLPKGVKILKLDNPQSSQIYEQPLAITAGTTISEVKNLLESINKIEEN